MLEVCGATQCSMDLGHARVDVFDFPRHEGHAGQSLKAVYCPHDRLDCHVLVTGLVDLCVEKISVILLGMLRPSVVICSWTYQCFLGFSRVWALIPRPMEAPQHEKGSYKVGSCTPRQTCR